MNCQNIESVILNLNRLGPPAAMRSITRHIGGDLERLKSLRATLDRLIDGRIKTASEACNDYQNEVVLRCLGIE